MESILRRMKVDNYCRRTKTTTRRTGATKESRVGNTWIQRSGRWRPQEEEDDAKEEGFSGRLVSWICGLLGSFVIYLRVILGVYGFDCPPPGFLFSCVGRISTPYECMHLKTSTVLSPLSLVRYLSLLTAREDIGILFDRQ